MLNQALISAPAPPLHPADTVGQAIDLLEELKVNQWPVVDEGVYKGLILDDMLIDADEDRTLSSFLYDLMPLSVQADEHFLSAVRMMTGSRLNVVAVTSQEKEYTGVILQNDLLQRLSAYAGAEAPGGMIVLEISPQDYAPGEINRLVETNNAQIRQLNTEFSEETGLLRVVIRINKQEISDIIATFQRYDYRVVYFAGEQQYENELRRNYHHLLHFLEM
jgi:acetoin utilization protein AcuB